MKVARGRSGYISYYSPLHYHPYTLRRSWLRHCVTSQKVTGSIPDSVIGIFY